MAKDYIAVDVAHVMPRISMSVKVKRTPATRLRLWLASRLFYLAGIVLDVGDIEIGFGSAEG